MKEIYYQNQSPGQRQNKTSIRDDLIQLQKDQAKRHKAQEEKDKVSENHSIKVGKTIFYLTIGIGTLWASQFILSAIAGLIRQIKNVKRAWRE